jgi:hypothetical protein
VTDTETVIIVHRGREFVAKRTMAELFMKQARRTINNLESELVPLAHAKGVDLLFITRTTPFHAQYPSGQSKRL